MGNGLEAGQVEGGEASYEATAGILKSRDEGLNHGNDGGNGLQEVRVEPRQFEEIISTGVGDQ